MISFQRLLGREDAFFTLLEQSAQQGVNAVTALQRITTNPSVTPTLEEFVLARRKDKEITNELEEMLIHTFVTPIEREDIEALAERLYKIPKTIEKFAERYILTAPQIRGVDFMRQVSLLAEAMDLVLKMVQDLRTGDLAGIKSRQHALQTVEAAADDVLIEYISQLYLPDFPALKAVILRDLYDLVERAIDRCRDCGNVISLVLLKNS
jgi:uncharacterized protein Yka (UPF0111/DUF47 family)